MILYLDTSSSVLYCALYRDGEVFAYLKEPLSKDLSKDALYLISEMFRKCDVSVTDIKKIIVVNGPGSFTGIRIGLTISKIFAWSKKIDVIPISSIEAMAYSLEGEANYVVPLIDAKHGFVYSSIYDNLNNSFIMNEKYISLDTLLVTLDSIDGKVVFITNDTFEGIGNTIKYSPNFLNIIEKTKNRSSVNVHSLDANYLKRTEAEENLNDKRSNS